MPKAPAHTRTIRVEATGVDSEHMSLVGTLEDMMPGLPSDYEDHKFHDLRMTWRVHLPDLVIVAVEGEMRRFPHDECPDILPKLQELVGLTIVRGFVRSVHDRISGPAGCTHLGHLAVAMGAAAVQSVWAVMSPDMEPVSMEDWSAALSGTCQIWAPDGPGPKKVAAGWDFDGPPWPKPRFKDA